MSCLCEGPEACSHVWLHVSFRRRWSFEHGIFMRMCSSGNWMNRSISNLNKRMSERGKGSLE